MENEERKALKEVLELIRSAVMVGDMIIAGNNREAYAWTDDIVDEAKKVTSLVKEAWNKS